jgi:5-enolpyruvylshikimate-3-phosphate synthase
VEQDINTLRTYGQDKSYSFSKNRVVRCLDEIGNTIYLLFNKSYAGKVDNTDQQRLNFKTQIISYINTLQNMGAVQNFSASSDIEVNQGESIDSVVVDLSIQPVDSMEKLYMTVYVND